jgi:hypothetical protein
MAICGMTQFGKHSRGYMQAIMQARHGFAREMHREWRHRSTSRALGGATFVKCASTIVRFDGIIFGR